ncbi:LOW QUALITY PROTEIN: hypothetical protein PHMEG_00028483 [Phytophthora megakarya]|uniref:Uncharacterized protein n=1 Tax=Phytophthora megakarya TaxID=4795 RepID=A0A225V5G8_9STRA|nr:LOW QUALITY PROTEIN: hypothetical protein PHMEG_00028483 [Phytophthora megakarya]
MVFTGNKGYLEQTAGNEGQLRLVCGPVEDFLVSIVDLESWSDMRPPSLGQARFDARDIAAKDSILGKVLKADADMICHEMSAMDIRLSGKHETADKPYRAVPPFPNAPDNDSGAGADEEIIVSDDDDGVPDHESNFVVPVGDPRCGCYANGKSSSGKSDWKRPAKQSHRSSKAMRLVEMETTHVNVKVHSCPTVHLEYVKQPLRFIIAQEITVGEVVSWFPDFLVLANLRQDTVLSMQAGFSYSLSVMMIVTTPRLPTSSLRPTCTHLIQIMYLQCLNETLWTRNVPDKYFRTAKVALKSRLLPGVYPSKWPNFCNVKAVSLSAHESIEIRDSEEEDDPADEDYNSKEDAEFQLENGGSASSEDETETVSERAEWKYPEFFSSSDDSSEYEAVKRKSQSKQDSITPRDSPAKDNSAKRLKPKTAPQSKSRVKWKRRSSGSSSESESGGKKLTYTPSSKRPRPRGNNGRTKSRLAQLKNDELSDADKAVIESSDRGVISWHRYEILCRFSPKKDGTEDQTPGFSDYASQMSDIVFLERRLLPMLNQYLALISKRLWKVMFADWEKYLYFHLWKELTHTAVKAIDKHVKFMKDNARAFWDMLLWFVMKTQPENGEDAGEHSDGYATSSAIYTDRSTRNETVGRGFEKLFRETIVWEPNFWIYPLNVLPVLGTPQDSYGKFTLDQQVKAAEREFPSRTQWPVYCSDIDRFAHIPEEVRDQIKPESVRRQNPIQSPAAEVLL